MATPRQLLTQAKGVIRQPNMQGTRGGPARGGAAARPRGGGGMNAGGAAPSLTFPGFVPRSGEKPMQRGLSGATSAADPGGPEGPIGPAMAEGGANFGAPGPGGPPVPAWQALRAAGLQGQGSAAANRARAAQLPGGPSDFGPASAAATLSAAATEAAAPDMPTTSPGGAPGGSGSFPRPGAEPALGGGGGGVARMFPGFKPGGGMIARPMPATISTPAPPAGLGQTISDPADQMGGGGFAAMGRLGARQQAMARRQMA